jgi:predicted ArsR family transcriptional regulator
LLDFLRAQGEATVRALSEHLGITQTGVRQHLARLERDGHVRSRGVRGRVGRPALLYRLTEDGERLFPKAYDRLAIGAIEAAAASFDGEDLHRFVQAAAGRVAARLDCTSRGTLRERAEGLASALAAEGAVVEVVQVDGGKGADGARAPEGALLVSQYTCPYDDAAAASDLTCAIDREVFRLCTGADVEVLAVRARGDDHCLFRLSPPGRGV